jgi:vacuolar-type H+-ATPase subunit H
MKQTAVEWLVKNCHIVPKNELNKRELINQAKEMEKQQIIDAQENGQSIYSDVIKCDKSKQYYNETFNK